MTRDSPCLQELMVLFAKIRWMLQSVNSASTLKGVTVLPLVVSEKPLIVSLSVYMFCEVPGERCVDVSITSPSKGSISIPERLDVTILPGSAEWYCIELLHAGRRDCEAYGAKQKAERRSCSEG